MKYRNLRIIGTSHIAVQSINEIKRIIDESNPGVVAVELDKQRLYALMHPEARKKSVSMKDIKYIGITGFVFSLIASWAEKKLGKLVNTKPGDDMMAAAGMAHKKGIRLELIDQHVNITLKRLSEAITFREKLNFVWDIFMSVFFGKHEMKKLGLQSFDLRRVPSQNVIDIMMKKLRKRYPSLHHVLVKERNEYMAKRLVMLMKKSNDEVVAVVGAGHAEEILKIVKSNINKLDII